MSAAPLEHWSVIVDDELVGELVVEGSLMGAGMVDTAPVVESITRTVFIAAVIAALTGLLLAAVLCAPDYAPGRSRTRHGALLPATCMCAPVKSDDEVGELTDTFNQMAASLEQQETLRQSMMADIAHELRTPLTGLQGAIEAMRDGVFPADAENLEALHVEVLLLNRLVDDLRTLANAEAGRKPRWRKRRSTSPNCAAAR